MPKQISEKFNTLTTESEISSNGVGHSTMQKSLGGASAEVSPEELQLALVASQNTIQALTNELENLKKAQTPSTSNSDSLNTLVELLANAVTNKHTGPVDADNLNRTDNFKERASVDGKSLMEAQATLNMYKHEPKEYVSIPKTFASQFGPTLSITVNGVRVSIPVDGKSYKINRTHALHAKERIAKVDRLLSDTAANIIETEA